MNNTDASKTFAAKVWFFTWLVLSIAQLAIVHCHYQREIFPFIFLISVIALFGSLPAVVILLSCIESVANKRCSLPQKLLRLLLLEFFCCGLHGNITYMVTADSGVCSFSAAGITIAVLFGCNSFSVLWNHEVLKNYLYRDVFLSKATS